MIRALVITATAGLALVGLGAAARQIGFEFPLGEVPPELASADAETVVANCSSCHSLDYITTQPRGKGEKFWRDSVTKMVTVYKAPMAAEDAAKVAAVLARKFG
jgi:hypothetical protein